MLFFLKRLHENLLITQKIIYFANNKHKTDVYNLTNNNSKNLIPASIWNLVNATLAERMLTPS